MEGYAKGEASGAHDRAFLELAHLYDSLAALSPAARLPWIKEIIARAPTAYAISAVLEDLQASLAYIVRTLGFSHWTYDEVLLLLLNREQIALVQALFEQVYRIDLDLSLAEVDEMIQRKLRSHLDGKPARRIYHRLYLTP
jgi:hypothetical protein